MNGPFRQVADCSTFATYEAAHIYYALSPAAQPLLDPDEDGLACEIWFGVEVPACLPGGPLPSESMARDSFDAC